MTQQEHIAIRCLMFVCPIWPLGEGSVCFWPRNVGSMQIIKHRFEFPVRKPDSRSKVRGYTCSSTFYIGACVYLSSALQASLSLSPSLVDHSDLPILIYMSIDVSCILYIHIHTYASVHTAHEERRILRGVLVITWQHEEWVEMNSMYIQASRSSLTISHDIRAQVFLRASRRFSN